MIRVALHPLTPLVAVVKSIGAGNRAFRTQIDARSPRNAGKTATTVSESLQTIADADSRVSVIAWNLVQLKAAAFWPPAHAAKASKAVR